MKNIKDYILENIEKITFDNFYEKTVAVFDWVKERPDNKPDYVSKKNNSRKYNDDDTFTDKISSEYWYKSDSGGKYIIRGSNHWSIIRIKSFKIENDYYKLHSNHTYTPIASCYWGLYRPLEEGEKYNDYIKSIFNSNIIYAKCYLNNFQKIKD